MFNENQKMQKLDESFYLVLLILFILCQFL